MNEFIPDESSVWDIREHIKILKERDYVLEHYLLTSDDIESLAGAVNYASLFFSGEGWPELEERIINYPWLTYWYTIHVINNRFPKGEETIALDGQCAFLYAKHIIKSRFPKGEQVISASPVWAYAYAVEVIKGRFPAGEKAIAQCPEYSYWYDYFLESLDYG